MAPRHTALRSRSSKPSVGGTKAYPGWLPSSRYSMIRCGMSGGVGQAGLWADSVEELGHRFRYSLAGFQTGGTDHIVIAYPLGLRFQAAGFVAVVFEDVVERRPVGPQVGFVRHEHEQLEPFGGDDLFVNHLQDEVERVFMLVEVVVVNHKDDAARFGVAQQVNPIRLPHRVFAAHITLRFEAHSLTVDFRREDRHSLASGGGWIGIEVFELREI